MHLFSLSHITRFITLINFDIIVIGSTLSMSQQESCYSTDEEYFLDVCRQGNIQQLKQFIEGLPQLSTFDWQWVSYSNDNFIHMLAGNNHYTAFDLIWPIIKEKCSREQIEIILNQQNSSNSTPLHYCVIPESKEMVERLIQAGANPNIKNQFGRTPFEEAEKFEKYEIAEILAPISKTDLEALKKQVGDIKLNDESSDEEQGETSEPIKQEANEEQQGSKQQQKAEN